LQSSRITSFIVMAPAQQSRYAIYFVPSPQSRLAAFGETLFQCQQLPAFLAGMVDEGWNAAAVRYGFHATLKAPFHLRPNHTEADIRAAALFVAAAIPRFQVDRLVVSRIDDFIALTPAPHAAPELGQLAAACVRGFEHLRAPLSAADRERRLAVGLSARETAHLDSWGYPYVFDQFQFHMTLTGPVAPEHAEAMQRALAVHYAAFDHPVGIDAITISRQPSRDASFHIWQRFELPAR
jgi:Protein of unknown function (DUF1045)